MSSKKCNKTAEMSEKGWSQSLCPYFVVFTNTRRCHLKRRQKNMNMTLSDSITQKWWKKCRGRMQFCKCDGGILMTREWIWSESHWGSSLTSHSRERDSLLTTTSDNDRKFKFMVTRRHILFIWSTLKSPYPHIIIGQKISQSLIFFSYNPISTPTARARNRKFYESAKKGVQCAHKMQ